MFRKLRIKFIAITMTMVAVVMALSFTAVCVIEYQRSYSVVETALDDAVRQAQDGPFGNGPQGQWEGREQDDGLAGGRLRFPEAVREADDLDDLGEVDDLDDVMDLIDPDDLDDDAEGATPPRIGNREGEAHASSSLIPVAVYSAAPDGRMNLVPQVTSASISDDVLSEAAGLVMEQPDGYGAIDGLGLHYLKATDDGRTYLAFTDTSYTDGWKTLALMLALVGAGALAVFLVVSLFYSRWALKPVREAWDAQRQFVADASHDLKTPLTVILANAAILLKHPERSIASESQWVESTQVEAQNMQGLVNEMLELAQVEAGQEVERVREPVDLSNLVEGETLLFDSMALERNCAFDCKIEDGITVTGDEKQLEKMVATLVENAFKYVDENGAIDVVARKAGKQATVAIHNTGSSISPDDLPHIFDRFYRTDKARTSGAGGFGLGLAIAREIARQHDGDITCTSTEADGTTFTIALPLA